MLSGDLEAISETENIIGTCPCLGYVDGVPVCISGNKIEEVELFNVHPELISHISSSPSRAATVCLPLCFGCVRVDPNGVVKCASQNKVITIRDHALTEMELIDAMNNFPRDMFTSEQDICTECLYKVLVSIILSFGSEL